MIVAKTLFILLVGILAMMTLRGLYGGLQRARARVRPNRVVRLRKDPRTGVYYPEE